MRNEQPALTVVVPCYNEGRRLAALFDRIDALADYGWAWVLVDDGSRDETPRCLSAFVDRTPVQARYIHQAANRGKGAAVMAGFLAARTPYVAFMDADLATEPAALADFLERATGRTSPAIVIGSRQHGPRTPVRRSLWRALMGRGFAAFVRIITGLDVRDTQCGLKLLPTKHAQRIVTQMSAAGLAFDVELLLRCRAHGMEIVEVPVAWEEVAGGSVRWYHAFRMAADVVRAAHRLRRGS